MWVLLAAFIQVYTENHEQKAPKQHVIPVASVGSRLSVPAEGMWKLIKIPSYPGSLESLGTLLLSGVCFLLRTC